MRRQAEEVKTKIMSLLSEIKRDGMDSLIEWLPKSSFFTMPSSTRFHGNYEGGLAEHSLNVYECLEKLCHEHSIQFGTEFDEDSIRIIALCHDFCKIGYYKPDFRNVKNNETGQWEKKQIYVTDDKLGMGHGEGSVYMLQSYIHLTREEALAIRHHMGGWDTAARGGDYSMNVAKDRTPLVTLVQLADMWASSFMEETVE